MSRFTGLALIRVIGIIAILWTTLVAAHTHTHTHTHAPIVNEFQLADGSSFTMEEDTGVQLEAEPIKHHPSTEDHVLVETDNVNQITPVYAETNAKSDNSDVSMIEAASSSSTPSFIHQEDVFSTDQGERVLMEQDISFADAIEAETVDVLTTDGSVYQTKAKSEDKKEGVAPSSKSEQPTDASLLAQSSSTHSTIGLTSSAWREPTYIENPAREAEERRRAEEEAARAKAEFVRPLVMSRDGQLKLKKTPKPSEQARFQQVNAKSAAYIGPLPTMPAQETKLPEFLVDAPSNGKVMLESHSKHKKAAANGEDDIFPFEYRKLRMPSLATVLSVVSIPGAVSQELLNATSPRGTVYPKGTVLAPGLVLPPDVWIGERPTKPNAFKPITITAEQDDAASILDRIRPSQGNGEKAKTGPKPKNAVMVNGKPAQVVIGPTPNVRQAVEAAVGAPGDTMKLLKAVEQIVTNEPVAQLAPVSEPGQPIELPDQPIPIPENFAQQQAATAASTPIPNPIDAPMTPSGELQVPPLAYPYTPVLQLSPVVAGTATVASKAAEDAAAAQAAAAAAAAEAEAEAAEAPSTRPPPPAPKQPVAAPRFAQLDSNIAQLNERELELERILARATAVTEASIKLQTAAANAAEAQLKNANVNLGSTVEADVFPEAQAFVELRSMTASEGETDAKADIDSDLDNDADLDIDTDADADTDSDSDLLDGDSVEPADFDTEGTMPITNKARFAQVDTDAEVDAEVDADHIAQVETEAAVASETETETEAAADSQTETETETENETETESESAAESESESGAAATTATAALTQAETDAEATAETEVGTDAATESETETETSSTATVSTSSGSETPVEADVVVRTKSNVVEMVGPLEHPGIVHSDRHFWPSEEKLTAKEVRAINVLKKSYTTPEFKPSEHDADVYTCSSAETHPVQAPVFTSSFAAIPAYSCAVSRFISVKAWTKCHNKHQKCYLSCQHLQKECDQKLQHCLMDECGTGSGPSSNCPPAAISTTNPNEIDKNYPICVEHLLPILQQRYFNTSAYKTCQSHACMCVRVTEKERSTRKQPKEVQPPSALESWPFYTIEKSSEDEAVLLELDANVDSTPSKTLSVPNFDSLDAGDLIPHTSRFGVPGLKAVRGDRPDVRSMSSASQVIGVDYSLNGEVKAGFVIAKGRKVLEHYIPTCARLAGGRQLGIFVSHVGGEAGSKTPSHQLLMGVTQQGEGRGVIMTTNLIIVMFPQRMEVFNQWTPSLMDVPHGAIGVLTMQIWSSVWEQSLFYDIISATLERLGEAPVVFHTQKHGVVPASLPTPVHSESDPADRFVTAADALLHAHSTRSSGFWIESVSFVFPARVRLVVKSTNPTQQSLNIEVRGWSEAHAHANMTTQLDIDMSRFTLSVPTHPDTTGEEMFLGSMAIHTQVVEMELHDTIDSVFILKDLAHDGPDAHLYTDQVFTNLGYFFYFSVGTDEAHLLAGSNTWIAGGNDQRKAYPELFTPSTGADSNVPFAKIVVPASEARLQPIVLPGSGVLQFVHEGPTATGLVGVARSLTPLATPVDLTQYWGVSVLVRSLTAGTITLQLQVESSTVKDYSYHKSDILHISKDDCWSHIQLPWSSFHSSSGRRLDLQTITKVTLILPVVGEMGDIARLELSSVTIQTGPLPLAHRIAAAPCSFIDEFDSSTLSTPSVAHSRPRIASHLIRSNPFAFAELVESDQSAAATSRLPIITITLLAFLSVLYNRYLQ